MKHDLAHSPKKRLCSESHNTPTDNSLDQAPVVMPTPSSNSSSLLEHLAFDKNLLECSRTLWKFGDWESLANIEHESLQHHPDRAKLAILAAAGHAQCGNIEKAKWLTRLALEWGCEKNLANQVLIAGVHNSLGRAFALAGHPARSLSHFGTSIKIGTFRGEHHLLVEARSNTQYAQLNLSFGKLALKKGYRPPEAHCRLSCHKTTNSAPKDEVLEQQTIHIVVVGMRHSGSTALFNIIRLALEKSGVEFVSFYSEQENVEQKWRDNTPVKLIKTHEFRDDIAELADIIISTRRDLRDTVASAVRRNFSMLKRLGGPTQYAKYNRSLHDLWEERSNLIFEYENFMRNPITAMEEVFNVLGIEKIDTNLIYREITTLPLDQYTTTLLRPSHITDPEHKLSYRDTLSEAIADRITTEHHAWLGRYGYL